LAELKIKNYCFTKNFEICPQNYQQPVDSGFALLTQSAKSIADAIIIFEKIEGDWKELYNPFSPIS
jgi:hypothetical protein